MPCVTLQNIQHEVILHGLREMTPENQVISHDLSVMFYGFNYSRRQEMHSTIQFMQSFEVNIGISQPENSDVHRGEAKMNITSREGLILMLIEKECNNCFVV